MIAADWDNLIKMYRQLPSHIDDLEEMFHSSTGIWKHEFSDIAVLQVLMKLLNFKICLKGGRFKLEMFRRPKAAQCNIEIMCEDVGGISYYACFSLTAKLKDCLFKKISCFTVRDRCHVLQKIHNPYLNCSSFEEALLKSEMQQFIKD